MRFSSATVEVNGKPLVAELTFADGTATITLTEDVVLNADQAIRVSIKASKKN